MIRRPPRSTRTDTLFPTRRSSDLHRDRRRARRAEVHGVVRRVRPDDHAGVAVHRVPAAAVEAAVALTPRIANAKKGASAPFFSGDARWATVGAHLGARAFPVMPIAPARKSTRLNSCHYCASRLSSAS